MTSSPEHHLSEEAIRRFYPVYMAQVESRLRAGARRYGDTSFARESEDLLAEVRNELLDISGWGFILWCKLQRLEEAIRAYRRSDGWKQRARILQRPAAK
jgi:hypothetical protein